MSRIGIVTNLDSRGLAKDANLLTKVLQTCGHETQLLQFDKNTESVFSLVIFLEVAPRHYVRVSRNPPWIFVNPEFLVPEYIQTIKKSFAKVFCKTHEAHRICMEMFGEKAHYTGFLSEDRYDPKIKRVPRLFLHVAGHSSAKNTQAVIDAWRWKRNGNYLNAQLIAVSDFEFKDLPENVAILNNIGDDQLLDLQNSAIFHLQPSATEGWSHVLHESLSVGANILSIDAPPMNEIRSAYKIPPCGYNMFNSVKMYQVSALDIYNAVSDLIQMGHNGFAGSGVPRQEFLAGNEAFAQCFKAHLEDLQSSPAVVAPVVKAPPLLRKTGEGKTVAFLGNFRASESTENQILWALEQRLGMQVLQLQEDQTCLDDLDAIEYADYFFWVRTPNWLMVAQPHMLEFLDRLRKLGIPSISIHLDKFWGIPEREKLIGVHPFFLTDFVFTADGSRQEDFKSRGVNHHYMRPAASEVFHHPGRPRAEWKCDVAFVGARTYHKEHPWRGEMISFLEQAYGKRFRLVENGIRGHDLNDFYASARVLIGDCFGSGRIPHYFSDRMVESPMRYGFLLSPDVEGLGIPLATFQPEDTSDLQKKIDYWLSHDAERQQKTEYCAKHVAMHDTWAVRLREIFEKVNQLPESKSRGLAAS